MQARFKINAECQGHLGVREHHRGTIQGKFKAGDRIKLREEFCERKGQGHTATVIGFSTARSSKGKLIIRRDGWQRNTIEVSTQWELAHDRLNVAAA